MTLRKVSRYAMDSSIDRILSDRLADPDRLAFTFTDEDESTVDFTYAQLLRRSADIARAMSVHAAPGDRAVLLLKPGLDYVASFIACWISRVIAVPAYPLRRNQRAARIESLLQDASPAIALVDDGSDARSTEATFPLRSSAPRLLQVDSVPVGC